MEVSIDVCKRLHVYPSDIILFQLFPVHLRRGNIVASEENCRARVYTLVPIASRAMCSRNKHQPVSRKSTSLNGDGKG